MSLCGFGIFYSLAASLIGVGVGRLDLLHTRERFLSW
jgi:hypothetical protein